MLCECRRLRPPDKYRCFPAWLYPLPAQLRARVTLSEKAQLSGGRVYPPVRSDMAKESRWSHVQASLEEITCTWTRCTLHSCLPAQPSLLSKRFLSPFSEEFSNLWKAVAQHCCIHARPWMCPPIVLSSAVLKLHEQAVAGNSEVKPVAVVWNGPGGHSGFVWSAHTTQVFFIFFPFVPTRLQGSS